MLQTRNGPLSQFYLFETGRVGETVFSFITGITHRRLTASGLTPRTWVTLLYQIHVCILAPHRECKIDLLQRACLMQHTERTTGPSRSMMRPQEGTLRRIVTMTHSSQPCCNVVGPCDSHSNVVWLAAACHVLSVNVRA